jgi:hypothetical protein
VPVVKTFELHPACTIFPAIIGPEFEALADDIAANGLRDEIVLYEDRVLDGRNRLRACEARGVEPRFVCWNPGPGDTPEAYVISANLHRRHLTDAQRAEIAAKLVTNTLGGGAPGVRGGAAKGITVAKAAEMLNVTTSRVNTERGKLRTQEARDRGEIIDPHVPSPAPEKKYVPQKRNTDTANFFKPSVQSAAADRSEQREFDEVITQLDEVTDKLSMWPRFVAAMPIERRKQLAMNLAVGLLLMKPREEPSSAGLRSAFPSGRSSDAA